MKVVIHHSLVTEFSCVAIQSIYTQFERLPRRPLPPSLSTQRPNSESRASSGVSIAMLELHYDENSRIWGHIFNIAYQYRKIAQMAKKTRLKKR